MTTCRGNLFFGKDSHLISRREAMPAMSDELSTWLSYQESVARETIERVRELLPQLPSHSHKEETEKLRALLSESSQWDIPKIVTILLDICRDEKISAAVELLELFCDKMDLEDIATVHGFLSLPDSNKKEIHALYVELWNLYLTNDLETIAYHLSKIKEIEDLTHDERIYTDRLRTVLFFRKAVKLPSYEHPVLLQTNRFNGWCGGCRKHADEHEEHWYYYICFDCPRILVPKCGESPPEIQHPYHREHPLTLFTSEAPNNNDDKHCWVCAEKLWQLGYHCSICDFSIDPVCAGKPSPLAIEHPRCHEHTLNFLPRSIFFCCDGCGLVSECCPFVCLECGFMIHKDCINLPRIICITRHQHRLSFTYCLPPEKERSCGVCHRKVHWKFGQYYCNKGCAYVVHSKCATGREVWDGKDFEGVPEEIDDEASFERIDEGIIRHFGHPDHHLRLSEQHNGCDPFKLCKACILSIYPDPFYSCMECDDFTLHEACANLPRKKSHALHPHSLILHVDIPLNAIRLVEDAFVCLACGRLCHGFQYRCSVVGCHFEIDVRCASIADNLNHECHSHPLFLTSMKGYRQECSVCQEWSSCLLNCIDCPFCLCFNCVTIPLTMAYKHDEHPVTLCCGEDTTGQYWCQNCEEEINQDKWFYTCESCGTTLHVRCALGNWLYLKPGEPVKSGNEECEVVFIDQSRSQPICPDCGTRRCQYRKAVKLGGKYVCGLKS